MQVLVVLLRCVQVAVVVSAVVQVVVTVSAGGCLCLVGDGANEWCRFKIDEWLDYYYY